MMADDRLHNTQGRPAEGTLQQADAPFRSGVSGKYKLLIKEVTPKYRQYEYELTDFEGKTYKAASAVHFAANQILRCIVTFKIEHARLVVADTAICSKQDMATPIVEKPAPPKPALAQKPQSERVSQVKPDKVIPAEPVPVILEGSPSERGTTGLYRLKVEGVQEWNRYGTTKHLYYLSDTSGQLYQATSDKNYPSGSTEVCRVEVLKERKGNYYFTVFFKDESSKPVGLIDGEVLPRHHFIASPTPTRTPIPRDKKKSKKENKAKPETTPVYLNKYEKRGRYNFIATDERDEYGYQLMEDESGKLHLLTGTTQRYAKGEKVRCTVKGFGHKPVGKITGSYLVLSEPRKVVTERITVSIPYVKSPERWYSEVQGLGKHKCGKAFKCNCCGRSFPANAGVRVDLKEIYFCNSCARKIYEPVGRGNHHVFISTPMGNKR